MKRWEDNRGEAAERVPLLPKELWAMISTMERRERGQLEAWRRWADAKLMQLVVEWFRMGAQVATQSFVIFSKSGKIEILSTKSDQFTRRKIRGFGSGNFAECFKIASKSFKMLQIASKSFKMLQNPSKCFKILQNPSKPFKIFKIL